jgi:ATP-dependent Lon protease
MREVAFEVPTAVKDALDIIPVERLEEVLYAAFDPPFLLLPVSKM